MVLKFEVKIHKAIKKLSVFAGRSLNSYSFDYVLVMANCTLHSYLIYFQPFC